MKRQIGKDLIGSRDLLMLYRGAQRCGYGWVAQEMREATDDEILAAARVIMDRITPMSAHCPYLIHDKGTCICEV